MSPGSFQARYWHMAQQSLSAGLLLALLAALAADETQNPAVMNHPIPQPLLTTATPAPASSGVWRRLADQAEISVRDSLSDLAPGVYDTPAGRQAVSTSLHPHDLARSLRGLPIQVYHTSAELGEAATTLQSVDAWSLLLLVQSMADRQAWPWPVAADKRPLRALSPLLKRSSQWWGMPPAPADSQDGFGDFPDLAAQKNALLIGADPHFTVCGILVEDRGIIGKIDYLDRVVSTALGHQVSEMDLGELLDGPTSHLHVATFDEGKRLSWGQPPHHADNPIWNLSSSRIWMVIIGMLLVIFSLRRMNKQSKAR